MDEDEIGMLTQGNMNIMNPVSEKKLILAGKYANLKPGMSVLDVGCGNGTLLSLWPRSSGFLDAALSYRKSRLPAQKNCSRGPASR